MTSFDKQKAAEYFIVAWVKDWRMQTYLDAIKFDGNYEDAHKLYPWMPTGKNIHYMIKNQLVRAWTALAMRSINDKLWDTEDNKKRLTLAKQIELWDADKVDASTQHKEAIKERNTAIRKIKQNAMEHKISMEIMRRGSGHHWNVVK